MDEPDKQIRIKPKVYLKLYELRRPGESFSTVIEKLINSRCTCDSERIPRILFG